MTSPDGKQANSLISRPDTSFATVARGERIVSRMVEGALEIARRTDLLSAGKRFTIGTYELREPDYRQVLWWAKSLQWSPEEVLDTLAGLRPVSYAPIKLRIEDGSIRELVWDSERMPLENFEWEAGLSIQTLAIRRRMPKWRSGAVLPSLRVLYVKWLSLVELDLSPMPGLTELFCCGNDLTHLDLSPVPALTRLDCWHNPLTALDLSPVPRLVELKCSGSSLTELDLRPLDNPDIDVDCNTCVCIIR